MEIYNSRDKFYKSKFGAVASGESLRLRLLVHNDAKASSAYLRVHRDGEDGIKEIPLNPADSYDDYRIYECETAFQTGLYFYSFRYLSELGEFFVTADEHNTAIISDQGNWWQLTCYDADYKTPDWLRGGIIYQIFPDRFYSSGRRKKHIPEDRFIVEDKTKTPEFRQKNGICSLGNDYYGGDLCGIREKLPYLASLGVSCIYLNPIFEAHSNHRYNTADYSRIDDMLGDEKDLKKLCRAAKKHGIEIILDGVFSHTGNDSIYFNEYRRYTSLGAAESAQSPYRSWYKFDDSRLGYSAWWGVPSLPEINEDDPSFDEFITGEDGIIKKWMKCGIKGWRLDVADELPDNFLDHIRNAVKSADSEAYLLGEVWEDASNKISYNERRRYLQGKQLDSVMNYPFADAVIEFVRGGNGYEFTEKIMTVLENYPKQSVDLLMNHLGTHDTVRILTALGYDGEQPKTRAEQSVTRLSPTEYEKGIKRLRIAALLQYTLPGVPSLYYGDEAGMEGFGDPFCRGYYPWGKENTKLVEFYRWLGSLRKEHSVFKDGEFTPVVSGLGTVAFVRENENEKLLIAVNRWCDPDTITLPDEWQSAKSLYGNPPENGRLTINSVDFAILKL